MNSKQKVAKLAVFGLMAVLVSYEVALATYGSPNYQLKSFSVGGSGEDNISSNQYRAEVTIGEPSSEDLTGNATNGATGYYPTQQANVPDAPTITNVSSDYYNKLLVQIDNGGNPTDTTFAIAISSDNFTTTQFIQSDHTVGATLGLEDYQTYASWGSAGGFEVIGLTPNTTYYFKVKAMQGDFTETGYSTVVSVATVNPYLTFDIDVASTDTETDPPFTIDFGDLSTTVTTASNKIWVDFATNGSAGGSIYVNATNGGLYSVSTNTTVTSASADLATAASGFGLRVNSVATTSGGPLTAVSPYNGSAENVGALDNTIRPLASSTNPLQGGRVELQLKAKVTSITPSASDYEEIATITGSASF